MNTLVGSSLQLGLRRVLARLLNLNDPRWGRGDEGAGPDAGQGSAPDQSDANTANTPNTAPTSAPNSDSAPNGRKPQSGNQPPDLDQLWNEFNQRLSQLFGGKGGRGSARPPSPQGGSPMGAKGPRIGVGLIAAVLGVGWLLSGIFIVQEGQQAVVTQFGKYLATRDAGFNWRMPWPIQAHETVTFTRLRSVDIGKDNLIAATGLRDAAMLTADENIVEVKFVVQYRLNDARAFLFESRDPEGAVVKAAETAVREVVGKMKMDAVLAEERDQIAPRVRTLMQALLDRYKVGVEVDAVNIAQGGVRPPEQVQAAFDDVLKAAQERERAKNEAEAYANSVIPEAKGAASRLLEEAQGYTADVVARAEGDAQRFSSLFTEYKAAPKVTRDRLYTDTMREVYSNTNKVIVDNKQGGNMLYLPLDKILQQSGTMPSSTAPAAPVTGPLSAGAVSPSAAAPTAGVNDAAGNRSRSRDVRP